MMEGYTETSSSNNGSSPLSKLSGQQDGIDLDGILNIRGSAKRGGRHQLRTSKATEADCVGAAATEESGDYPLSMSNTTKRQSMIPYRTLLSFATPLDYALMAIGALAAVAHGAVLPIVLVLLGRVMNSLGTNQSNLELAYQKICQISLIFVYIAVFSIWVNWLEVACWMYTGERQAAQIRKRYLKALLSQNMTFFDTEISTGEIVQRLCSDMLYIHEAIGEKVASFILNMSICVVGILVAFLQTWQVALLTLSTVPLLLGTGAIYGKIYTKFLARAQASTVNAGSIEGEAVAQVRTVYSLVGESQTVAAFSKALQATAKLGIRGGLAKGVGVGFSLGIVNFTWALALWFGGILIRKGKTDGGALLAAVFNVMYGGMALRQALPQLQIFSQGRVAALKVFEVIDRQVEVDSDLNGETLEFVRGEIEFRNVHFSYPSHPGMPIFSNLCLTIHPGETVVVVGSRGSGKSSLLMLLQRHYSPNSGEVMLDGKDIKELRLFWLRMKIGIVGQEPVLFSGTIRQNILFGKQDASIADVEAAAMAVNAHSFISKLPTGYDTLVGEGGMQLTDGQKQRLAIARAIVKKPTILLLDEAMSSLDAQSEHMVQNALESVMQGCTTIMVAHRLSSVQNADVIVVLDQGRVIETGSHTQLLERGSLSLYASFVHLQETRPARQDDGEASILASRVPMISNSLGSSPPRSSLQSGATSPLASLLQSPVTPSRTTELHNSYPDSPFIVELPPSPATPTGPLTHENSKTIMEFLREKEQAVIKGSLNVTYWRMCKLFTPEWLSIILGTLGAVITGSLNPFFNLYLIEAIELFYNPHKQHRKTRDKGHLWCIVIAGLGVANICSNIIQHFFYSKTGESSTNFVRTEVFKAVMRNEVGWFDSQDHRSPVLTAKTASCGTVMKVAISDRTSMCIQYFTSLGVAIALAFVLQWKIAAVTMILIPFTMLGSFMKGVFIKQGFAGNLEKSHEKATKLAVEAVSNVQTLKAFGMVEHIISQFTQHLQAPLRNSARRAHKGGLIFGVSQAGMHTANAVCIWYLALMVKEKQANYGTAFKVYQILAWMGYLLAEAMMLFPDLLKGIQATASLLDMANRKTESDPETSDGLQPIVVAGRIELENVTVCYPTRPTAAGLSNFNLIIPEGHTIALVGPSGCGTSTIIGLLERFYDPTWGDVLLDGFNIKTLNLKWLRKHIGLVQQEPSLFTLSIRDNIRYGKENATETEMIEAARRANAHGFISGLPRGYDTQVGEQGVQLTAGQRQRIAIARAVIRNPSILLLDKATSALHAETEKVVQDALDNIILEERRTTIVIAHHLATVQQADNIVFVKNGQVKEQGNHSSLMRMNGAYARLAHLQNLTLP